MSELYFFIRPDDVDKIQYRHATFLPNVKPAVFYKAGDIMWTVKFRNGAMKRFTFPAKREDI
jgi:hypothetical protein